MKDDVRILLVEDEAIIAEDVKQRLLRLGYAVSGIARDAEGAYARIAEGATDIVLMDIKIAGRIDGIEAANHIGEHYGLPVIFLTAHADAEATSRLTTSQAYGYILKPFNDGEIKAALELVRQKHLRYRHFLESSRWFQTVLEHIGDAVVVLDAQLRVHFINSAAAKFYADAPHPPMGKLIAETMTVTDAVTGVDQRSVFEQALGKMSK